MKIYGIDQSYQRTGISRIAFGIDGDVNAVSRSVSPWKAIDNPYSARHVAMHDHAYNITNMVGDDAVLAVMEGPSYGSKGKAVWQLSVLLDTVFGYLVERGIPVAVCPPTTRAKWATGKGNAAKDLVCIHVDRLWPNVGKNNDELDSLAFATMGAQWMRWNVPSLARHRAALAGVEWPDMKTLRGSVRPSGAVPGVITLGAGDNRLATPMSPCGTVPAGRLPSTEVSDLGASSVSDLGASSVSELRSLRYEMRAEPVN